MKDFYFTGDDYRYRFEVEAKRRFLELLRNRFNSGVEYKGARCKWDTIILNKAQELGRFLTDKKEELDFGDPAPSFSRIDNQEARNRILTITQSEANRLGISKSTLHYLRKNAKTRDSFKIYSKVAEKLVRPERSAKMNYP